MKKLMLVLAVSSALTAMARESDAEFDATAINASVSCQNASDTVRIWVSSEISVSEANEITVKQVIRKIENGERRVVCGNASVSTNDIKLETPTGGLAATESTYSCSRGGIGRVIGRGTRHTLTFNNENPGLQQGINGLFVSTRQSGEVRSSFDLACTIR